MTKTDGIEHVGKYLLYVEKVDNGKLDVYSTDNYAVYVLYKKMFEGD